MAMERVERRLAAILAGDIVGYSRLMGADEEGTLSQLTAFRGDFLDPKIVDHRGRIVKTTGDGVLVEFASVVDAVLCAIAIQHGIAERNETAAPDKRLEFRIGINVGDVMIQDGDIFGDGVNVAARLEGIADTGGICISEDAYRQVRGKLDVAFVDGGEQHLKNISQPVRVFRVQSSDSDSSPAPALPLPDKPSIAVVPFQNMSGDPAQDYFADGIVEDIITALSRMRWLFVIARNSSFAYKGKTPDVRQVGRELGVRYVLEGSVRKAGERIRVTAQLIDAATGNHLWAERYDRHVEDIFAIQDDITTSVVGRIGPELLAAEHTRASRKPPQSLDAWECVIRALFLSSQQSDEGSRNALSLLDRALDHDPDYAQALGMKGWILVWRAFQGWDDMGEALGLVKPLIARATAADNEEPWPYLAQGMVAYAIRDNGLAMAALTRAVALSPNFVNAHGLLGIAHAFGGRASEALACLDHAMRLSPRETFLSDFQLYYAFAYFQGAQYALALQAAQQSHRLRPGHPYPLLMAASCAGHLGQQETATALVQDLRAILPIASGAFVEATSPYVLREDRARLIEGLARAGLG